MNILIIHNNYTNRGGEESVVALQKQLFTDKGHRVITFEKSNDTSMSLIGKISLFTSGFYNSKVRRELSALLDKNQIDYCIVHNLYHKITPSVLIELKKRAIPTVMVLHNYRLLCPIGLLFRDGSICHDCPNSKILKEFNCVKRNCDKSFFNSLFLSLRSYYVRRSKIIVNNVDKLICLTPFQQQLFEQYGYKNCVTIHNTIYNSVNHRNNSNFDVVNCDKINNAECGSVVDVERQYFAFVGRLNYEKGIDVFFKLAEKMPTERFRVAGNISTLPPELNVPSNVEMCGFVSGDALVDFYRGAKAIFIGSRWYEGFILTLLEAFSNRCGVIFPSQGAFKTIADDGIDGIMYSHDNLDELVIKLENTNMLSFSQMGEAGFEKVNNIYDADSYYKKYIKVFEDIKNSMSI